MFIFFVFIDEADELSADFAEYPQVISKTWFAEELRYG